MTVLERVHDFLVQQSPRTICDDCIADRLELTVRQHANHKTRELAHKPTFKREIGPCAICKAEKKVIAYANRT